MSLGGTAMQNDIRQARCKGNAALGVDRVINVRTLGVLLPCMAGNGDVFGPEWLGW